MLFLSVNIDVCDCCGQESGRELDRGLELECGFVDANLNMEANLANLNVAGAELEGMISRKDNQQEP